MFFKFYDCLFYYNDKGEGGGRREFLIPLCEQNLFNNIFEGNNNNGRNEWVAVMSKIMEGEGFAGLSGNRRKFPGTRRGLKDGRALKIDKSS